MGGRHDPIWPLPRETCPPAPTEVQLCRDRRPRHPLAPPALSQMYSSAPSPNGAEGTRSSDRLEVLDCHREEQPDAGVFSHFGPGLFSGSATTCMETPPAPDRDGEGARWVSPTSCCTVLRLACLQILQIIHAKQPFRNHFLCFFETLLYSSICLI